MRAWWLGLLVIAPIAGAQAPVLAIALDAEPFGEPAVPMGDPVATTVRARVPCVPADPAARDVLFQVVRAPSWATLTFDPPRATFSAAECEQGLASVQARLVARASERAPAYEKAPFEVEAVADNGARGNTSAVVEAAHFFAFQASIDRPMTRTNGGTTEFLVRLANSGNTAITVHASVLDATEGFEAKAFEAEYVPQGDERAPLWLHGVDAPVGARGFANVSLRPTIADRPEMSGEPVVLTLTSVVQPPPPARIPASPVAVTVGTLGLAAIVLRRR